MRVIIFGLGCHLGFGNCGRLGRRNISLPKYQLDLEIAKKSKSSKLAQNEVLRALDNIALSLLNQKLIFYDFFLFDAPNRPKSIENEWHIQRLRN